MANFIIPENPEYTDQIRMFETDDPGHAGVFNPVIETLLHNEAFLKRWQEIAKQHIEDKNNSHNVTAEQLGLGNVDNTSDEDKPVSAPVQAALDALYKQLTGYTDTEIANLIGGAPTTLDTLGEIAKAMQDNDSVVDALEKAIGMKANAAEFDSHENDMTKHITAAERTKWNNKQDTTGDAKDNTVTFTSVDAENPTSWTAMALFKSKEKLSSLLNKASIMAKNVRYLYKMLGTTDISGLGDGTVTGALSQLNGNLDPIGTILEQKSNPVTIESNSMTKLAEVAITPGVWIIRCEVEFQNTNAYGSRIIMSGWGNTTQIGQEVPANANGWTKLAITDIYPETQSSTASVLAQQNSSVAMPCKGWIRAVRIK